VHDDLARAVRGERLELVGEARRDVRVDLARKPDNPGIASERSRADVKLEDGGSFRTRLARSAGYGRT
jgi:hypothetical protein